MVFGCIKKFISRKIGKVLNNSEPKIVNDELFVYERWFFVTTSKIWSTFEIVSLDKMLDVEIFEVHFESNIGYKMMLYGL